MLRILLSASDTGPAQELEVPADAQFTFNQPLHGWVTVTHGDLTWWFNGGFVIGVIPE